MFSDRLRWLKAALAAAAFVALCRQAKIDTDRAEPSLQRMPTSFDTLRGRRIAASTRRVAAADPDWIEIHSEAGPIRILGQTSPAARPGDVVSTVGEIVGPREIRPDRLRLHPGYAWKRPLNYAVSLLVLVAFLAWAIRRFQLRLPLPLFRSRY